jgi:acyl carrier protein
MVSQLELASKPAPTIRRSSFGSASSVPGTVATKGGFQLAMDEYGISLKLTKLEQIRFKRRIIEFIVDNHLSFKIVESETFQRAMDEYGISPELTNLEQIRFKRRIIEFIVENHLPLKIVESETFISLMASIRQRQCSAWASSSPSCGPQTTVLPNSDWPSGFVQTASLTKSNWLWVNSKGPMMQLSIEWSILIWPILLYTCVLLRFSLLLAI